MSTVLARRVASTPVRTASETWEKIMSLLAPDPTSDARSELVKVSGVACSSISSEATKDAPVVVYGGGPRVRIYCIFGDDAITGENVNEDPLPQSPAQGDWKMSIPCLPEDVGWSQTKLASVSRRATARPLEEDVEDNETKPKSSGRSLSINMEEFLKP